MMTIPSDDRPADPRTLPTLDDTDRRIVAFLDRDPRATTVWIAQSLGLARGTVHARLERLHRAGVFRPHSLRVSHHALGLPLRTFVMAEVDQATFGALVSELQQIDEVTEVVGIAGPSDLLIQIVARDADHVYEITQRIMRCRGIRRTSSSIVLRELVPHRIAQLL